MSEHISGALAPDDEGEQTFVVGPSAQKQNDAFVAAMQSAIRKGRERATVGIKTAAPEDMRYTRTIRAETVVPRSSSMDF